MDIGSTDSHLPPLNDRGRGAEISDELVQANREKIRALRDSLAELDQTRREALQSARKEAARIELDASRESAASRRASEGPEVDRVDLSERASALLDTMGSDEPARLDEVRARLERGELHTPEALARAAERMLGGERAAG